MIGPQMSEYGIGLFAALEIRIQGTALSLDALGAVITHLKSFIDPDK